MIRKFLYLNLLMLSSLVALQILFGTLAYASQMDANVDGYIYVSGDQSYFRGQFDYNSLTNTLFTGPNSEIIVDEQTSSSLNVSGELNQILSEETMHLNTNIDSFVSVDEIGLHAGTLFDLSGASVFRNPDPESTEPEIYTPFNYINIAATATAYYEFKLYTEDTEASFNFNLDGWQSINGPVDNMDKAASVIDFRLESIESQDAKGFYNKISATEGERNVHIDDDISLNVSTVAGSWNTFRLTLYNYIWLAGPGDFEEDGGIGSYDFMSDFSNTLTISDIVTDSGVIFAEEDFLYADSLGIQTASLGTIPTSPVPEPATMLLFGTGFLGLTGISIRRKKK